MTFSINKNACFTSIGFFFQIRSKEVLEMYVLVILKHMLCICLNLFL